MIRLTTTAGHELIICDQFITAIKDHPTSESSSTIYCGSTYHFVRETAKEILELMAKAKFVHPDNVDDTGRPIFTPPLENKDDNSPV